MHNLKLIRSNPEIFSEKLKDRNVNFDLKNLLNIDKENRELIQKKEKLEQEKKLISKQKDKTQFEKSKQISKEITNIEKKQETTEKNIFKLLSELPNLALDDVPKGKDEKFNKEIKKEGNIKDFDFKPLSHYELGEINKMMDFELAANTSGTRFVFLKNEFALMERAISNFMLDIHTKEYQYQEISPPLVANFSTMFGTGQIPKFEKDQFELKLDETDNSRKFLIPSA